MDLVARVLADVAARQPVDERERDSIAEILATVPRLERPFDVDADPTHLTGSAFIVGRRGIVLLRHRRLGIWVQPGGHIDPGETPWEAARREAIEETGLMVRQLGPEPELAHVDVHPGGRGHTHLDLRYMVTADDTDPAPPADESQEVAWFDWHQAADVAESAMGTILETLAMRFTNLRS